MERTVWSIGHSTRTLDEFIEAVTAHGIGAIADIRRFPGSRRLPHFHRDALQAGLPGAGIEYHWIPQLGGRRSARDSGPEDAGWRHPSFRGYSAHTRSAEFAEGLEILLRIAGRIDTAMMCAELLWWRCHRRIVADILVARGVPVIHIMPGNDTHPHLLRPPGRLVEGRVEYPAPDE